MIDFSPTTASAGTQQETSPEIRRTDRVLDLKPGSILTVKSSLPDSYQYGSSGPFKCAVFARSILSEDIVLFEASDRLGTSQFPLLKVCLAQNERIDFRKYWSLEKNKTMTLKSISSGYSADSKLFIKMTFVTDQNNSIESLTILGADKDLTVDKLVDYHFYGRMELSAPLN